MSKSIGKYHTVVLQPHLIKIIPKPASHQPKVFSGGDAVDAPEKLKTKIYGFDLDSTLIETKSRMKFSRNPQDWKFLDFNLAELKGEPEDPDAGAAAKVTTLDALVKLLDGCGGGDKDGSERVEIVIFSNQGGVITVPKDSKSCVKLLDKLQDILSTIETRLEECGKVQFMHRIWIYCSPKMPSSLKNGPKKKGSSAVKKTQSLQKFFGESQGKVSKNTASQDCSTETDPTLLFQKMRKPETGMFESFTQDKKTHGTSLFNLEQDPITLDFYCGDAAGRKNDFSDSDLKFANNLKTTFLTPEEFMVKYM